MLIGCNKQSTPLIFNEIILNNDLKGYSKELDIQNDTLYVVNEEEGLLIYEIKIDTFYWFDNSGTDSTINTSIIVDKIYSDTIVYQNWNLSGIQYFDSLRTIIILDKFYSVQHATLTSIFENVDDKFNKLCCSVDYQHPSKMVVNQSNDNFEIFTLIRNKSFTVGIPTDIVTIYKTQMLKIGDLIIADEPIKIIDSLIYDANDIHYANNRLFVAHTNYENSEFKVYFRDNPNSTFTLDTTITTPATPNALYSKGDTLFVGMEDHGGVKVYNFESAENGEEISWLATGFSVKDLYWDSSNRLLLLSCGFQGVVVLELDDNMQEVESWILNTGYAYSSRNYLGNIIVATRNGLEIINLKNNQ
ncbi:MAG: hypothetical protein H8E85_02355 [Candidatus Marinimicrobia bacterium]|nr:hypothetical protein [Candidatus Neomarinimicrobiota bacterium]